MIALAAHTANADRLARWLATVLAAAIAALAPRVARAQDTTASATRTYLLDLRLGEASAVGGRTTALVGKGMVAGLGFAFEATPRSWGWVSFDLRPLESAYFDAGPRSLPAIGMYSITGGASRKFGRPIGRGRWRPLELGVGLGATRVELQSYGGGQPSGSPLPPDAELDHPSALRASWLVRWRPTAAARLHVALPLGSAFRIGGGVSLIATHVGEARMWDGGWEPTGVGSHYRPTTRLWSFGTVFTAPVTVSLALRL